MGKCIFCQKETNLVGRGCHSVCSECRTKPKIQNFEYCHTCYNKFLLEKSKQISYCTFSSLHGDGDVALCQIHAYCFECLQKSNNAKKIECKICLNSIQYFCISCGKYCEKNNMKRLHKNHNICNNCKNSNTLKLSCNQCRVESQNDVVKYNPQIRQDFYHQNYDQLLKIQQSPEYKPINSNPKSTEINSKNHTKNSVKGANQIAKCNTLNKKKQIERESKQNYNTITPHKSPEEYSNNLTNTIMVNAYNISGSNQPQMNNCYCTIHQQYYSLMACKDHPYCDNCIVYYLIKKFNQFIKNINANNLEWLNKFHKYGCYSQGCNKANYSCQFYQFLPYLIARIPEHDYQTRYLLNYFIPYSEGFNLVFNSCSNCKIKSKICTENICYSCQCHFNSISTY